MQFRNNLVKSTDLVSFQKRNLKFEFLKNLSHSINYLIRYLHEPKRNPTSLKQCPVLLNMNCLPLTVPERTLLKKMNSKQKGICLRGITETINK